MPLLSLQALPKGCVVQQEAAGLELVPLLCDVLTT
jgi:hypothetical protein